MVWLPFLLAFVIFSQGQDTPKIEAKMVRGPFAGGDSVHAIQEVALDLKGQATDPGDRVAVRVCSKEAMPVALLTAAASPFILHEYLEHYGFKDQQILYLRSEDCLARDRSIVVTEFWLIPKGAEPPASVESITSDQAQVEVVRTSDNIKTAKGYSAALRELIQKLRNRLEAVVVVVGFYHERPGSALERNLQKARSVLVSGNVQASRIHVGTAPLGGIPIGVEPEPRYPSLYVVSTSRKRSGQ